MPKHNGDIANGNSNNDTCAKHSIPQKRNIISTNFENNDMNSVHLSGRPTVLKSTSHSYHSTINNNKLLFQQRHSLLLNNNNDLAVVTTTPSLDSGTTSVTTSTLRRLSLREREQVFSNIKINTFIAVIKTNKKNLCLIKKK